MTALLSLTFTVSFLITFTTIKCDDYCSPKLCRVGVVHIGCGNNGKFAESCPKNARMISTKTLKKYIVNMHNEKRNLIAAGNLSRYEPAARMGTMQWDDELAQLAALNVKQCRMKHDKCRNTLTYKASGQNLAIMSLGKARSKKSIKELLQHRVDGWWNEHKDANMDIIAKYPSSYSGPAIGHFTIMAADRNVRCGCAAIRYKLGKLPNLLVCCNYATTNILGLPLYEAGATASKCATGKNPDYPNLCSVDEKYAPLKINVW